MSQRRFLIASALARLIRKEQGVAGRIVEGYFPARPDRDHFVSIEPGHCYLVLATGREGAGVEERAEVPRSQAEALLVGVVARVLGPVDGPALHRHGPGELISKLSLLTSCHAIDLAAGAT